MAGKVRRPSGPVGSTEALGPVHAARTWVHWQLLLPACRQLGASAMGGWCQARPPIWPMAVVWPEWEQAGLCDPMGLACRLLPVWVDIREGLKAGRGVWTRPAGDRAGSTGTPNSRHEAPCRAPPYGHSRGFKTLRGQHTEPYLGWGGDRHWSPGQLQPPGRSFLPEQVNSGHCTHVPGLGQG